MSTPRPLTDICAKSRRQTEVRRRMNRLIATVPIAVALITGQALPQQADPAQTQPPKVVKPAPKLTFADKTKQALQLVGATIDPSKSAADMVVSNYYDPKGGKTTIVITND